MDWLELCPVKNILEFYQRGGGQTDPIILKPISQLIFIWNESIVGNLAREGHIFLHNQST